MGNNALLNDLQCVLDEASGWGRTNSATAIEVAGQQMAKQVSLLMAASKAFATAVSPLAETLKAAHEMSEKELKELKKLLDQADDTRDKLKKYVLFAEENAKMAMKLAQSLKQPGVGLDIGPEPDPDKPFEQPASAHHVHPEVPKHTGEEWNLGTGLLPPQAMAAVKDLNQALYQALERLAKKLPDVGDDEKAIAKVLVTSFEKYLRPAMQKHWKHGAADTGPTKFAQQELSSFAYEVLGNTVDLSKVW